MNNKENIITYRIEKTNYDNSRQENAGINHNLNRISAMNTPLTKKMLTEEKIDNKINKIEKYVGCLTYKSIFNLLENNPNKDNLNNIMDNNKILKDNKNNYASNTSNKKLNKNQKYSINLKKSFQNINNETPEKYNDDIYYDMNDENLNNINNEFNNSIVLSNDIKYQKQYTPNLNTKKSLSNSINNDYSKNHNEYNENNNLLKYQKSEENLKKIGILDKNEFIKNIKEINDLDYLEDNNKNQKKEIIPEKELSNNNELLKGKDYIINNNNKNYRSDLTGKKGQYLNLVFPINNKDITKIKSPQNSFISTTNNSHLNNVLLPKNAYNNLINNKNKRNRSIGRENKYMNNLSNIENNINDIDLGDNNINDIDLGQMTSNNHILKKNNTYNLNLDFNTNSYYNKNLIENNNNYNLLPKYEEQNHFSTLSNADNDRSYSTNKSRKKLNNNFNKVKNIDSLIQNKIQNNHQNNQFKRFYTNLDSLTNEFSKSMGNKNGDSKINNISNNSHNYYFTEIQTLKNELKQKTIIINNYSKTINNYKNKNQSLLEKIKRILENTKIEKQSLLEQIKKYQKEIYFLKNNINLPNKTSENNSKNENYNINIYNYTDYIRQINELKEELEKYKKENNYLKILAIKYKNNNIKTNTNFIQTYIDDSSRNRFSSSGVLEKKYIQKSFSVSKTKRKLRASSLSKKIFEEGDLDILSDNNHVSSFILN